MGQRSSLEQILVVRNFKQLYTRLGITVDVCMDFDWWNEEIITCAKRQMMTIHDSQHKAKICTKTWDNHSKAWE